MTTQTARKNFVKKPDTCKCNDRDCPACKGNCFRPHTTTLYRADQEDYTGTNFCEYCADDAYDSGLFSPDYP